MEAYLVVTPTCDVIPILVLTASAESKVATGEQAFRVSVTGNSGAKRTDDVLCASLACCAGVECLEYDIHDTLTCKHISTTDCCCLRRTQ